MVSLLILGHLIEEIKEIKSKGVEVDVENFIISEVCKLDPSIS